MKKAELVFIPSPGLGHLIPIVGMAKLMISRNDTLSITILLMSLPFETNVNAYIQSFNNRYASISDRIRLTNLPNVDQTSSGTSFLASLVEGQKPNVKNNVLKLIEDSETTQLVGFVVGMFCTAMIDVANEFGVPSYVFFASSAASLGVMLYMQALNDDDKVDTTGLKDSDSKFSIPTFANPVPSRVLPSVIFNRDWHPVYYGNARRFKEVKGIIINSFSELEPQAIISLKNHNFKIPPVYPVGPIVNLDRDNGDGNSANTNKDMIMEWLDGQPPLSVVFLCFGSMGSFGDAQVKEIAVALEHSGHRFLWSLHRPLPKGKTGLPSDCTNFQDILPIGFLDRTVRIGKVIGWAPQVDILQHAAIGGFVSHCGWNSILESVWFGVPMAAWPLHSEQQLSAFELIIELGLAVEIKMDYRKEFKANEDDAMGNNIVGACDIERGINCVMDHDSEVRKKVKEVSDMSKRALMDGGSSHSTLGRLIEEIMRNMA